MTCAAVPSSGAVSVLMAATQRRAPAKAAKPRTRPKPDAAPPPPEPEPGSRRRHRMSSGFSTLRDAILFAMGLGIIAFEVFIAAKVDPTAIAVGVAMTGLPLVFGADSHRRDQNGGPPS